MRTTVIGAALVITLLLSAVADAQPRFGRAGAASGGSFGIIPFAGYLISESLVEGPLNTSLGASSAAIFGAQVSLPLTDWASLVGTGGIASGDLRAGLPLLGGVSVGDSRTVILDGGLELRPGAGSGVLRFVPVLQFGAGAVRRELTVAGIAAESTDFALSGGLGADFPIVPGAAVRLMAKDHYGPVDFGGVGPVGARSDNIHSLAITGGLRIAF
jgi:hypothetical protein